MEIELKEVIVHRIIKVEKEQSAKLDNSMTAMAINEESKKLVLELNKRYTRSRRKITIGKFDAETTSKFPEEFKLYIRDELNFLDFSQNSAKGLTNDIKNVTMAKGGYIVFARYFKTRNYLGIFLIRNKAGQIFEKTEEGTYGVNPSVHIDFEKVAMACRIDLNLFVTDENYLNFIDTKKEEVSKFFNNWISSMDIENNKNFSKILVNDILANIKLPKDAEGNEIDREAYKLNFRDYVRQLPDGNVNLKDLGQRFYKNENIFVDYVEEKGLNISNNFKIDKATVETIVAVKAEADNIKLHFPRKYYNSDKIKIIKEGDEEYIMIDSPNLVKNLRQKINND